MGHVKEPDGIDFEINSRPLTEEEEIAISDYIRTYKVKHRRKKTSAEKLIGTKRKKEKA